MTWILGPLPLLTILLLRALLFNAPLILVVLIARRRWSPRLSGSLMAAGFAAATAYTIWRLEWFDVWRHGIPPGDLLVIYLAYIAALAAAGWYFGALITVRPGHARSQAS